MRVLLPIHWEEPTSLQPLAIAAGALLGFSGPVLQFDDRGALIASEPEGHAIVRAVEQDAAPELRHAVDVSLVDGTARQVTLQATESDGVHTFDILILPLAEGGVLAIGREVTLHYNLRAALVESRQRYKDFVEISADFAWETGADGAFTFVSPRGALGYTAAELIGRQPTELLVSRQGGDAQVFTRTTPLEDVDVWLTRADGAAACLQVSVRPLLDRDGKAYGARGVCRDITEQRARDAELTQIRNRERILNHIVRSFRDEVDVAAMLRVAVETVARGVGADQCRIFRRADGSGFVFASGIGEGPVSVESSLLGRLERGEGMAEMAADGYRVLAASTRYHQSINGAVVLARAALRGPWSADDRLLVEDIANQIAIANEQISAHEDLIRISRVDGLTGLLNRRAFFEELARRFSRLQRGQQSAALMYVDLDNFKLVNDQRGHAAGDEVLRLVRDLLVERTRPTDIVARLGGDEFAVWLDNADETIASERARDLLELARERLLPLSGLPGRPLSLSIGIAVYLPSRRESMEQVVARADHAMYLIKRGPKGNFTVAGSAAAEALQAETAP